MSKVVIKTRTINKIVELRHHNRGILWLKIDQEARVQARVKVLVEADKLHPYSVVFNIYRTRMLKRSFQGVAQAKGLSRLQHMKHL